MKLKSLAFAACLSTLAIAFAPAARADDWNKKTILTVNEPLMIPGKVLQPGKYVMKLADSTSNRHIVQVFNEDESQLQTTILAIPDYRVEPTGKSQFAFWEMPAGQPRALKAWFYPGDNFGQEFAYPKDVAAQIAQASNQNVPAITNNASNMNEAEVGQVTPSGQVQPMENNQQNAQTTTQSTTSQSTASSAAAAPTPAQPAQQPGAEAQNQQATETAQNRQSTEPAQTQQPAQPQTNAQAGTATNETNQAAATQPSAPSATANNQPLPRTGSPLPLIGLLGLLSLAAAGALRLNARRAAR